MAINLITGIPGHGKTLFMVRKLVDELIPQAEREGREIFHNIAGFQHKSESVHAASDEMILEWYSDEAPDGAIYVIDECQFLFPVRNPSAKVPEHVEKLTVHRHRGIDFYLITQHGSLLDRFVIPLVESHSDVYRPYGMKLSRVTAFPYYAPRTKPTAALGMGETSRLKFDPKYFSYYKSATQHTMQPSLPWRKIGLLVGLAVFAVGVTYFGVSSMWGRSQQATEAIAAIAPAERCAPRPLYAVGASTFPPDARSPGLTVLPRNARNC